MAIIIDYLAVLKSIQKIPTAENAYKVAKKIIENYDPKDGFLWANLFYDDDGIIFGGFDLGNPEDESSPLSLLMNIMAYTNESGEEKVWDMPIMARSRKIIKRDGTFLNKLDHQQHESVSIRPLIEIVSLMPVSRPNQPHDFQTTYSLDIKVPYGFEADFDYLSVMSMFEGKITEHFSNHQNDRCFVSWYGDNRFDTPLITKHKMTKLDLLLYRSTEDYTKNTKPGEEEIFFDSEFPVQPIEVSLIPICDGSYNQSIDTLKRITSNSKPL